jgi:hypothetical protein
MGTSKRNKVSEKFRKHRTGAWDDRIREQRLEKGKGTDTAVGHLKKRKKKIPQRKRREQIISREFVINNFSEKVKRIFKEIKEERIIFSSKTIKSVKKENKREIVGKNEEKKQQKQQQQDIQEQQDQERGGGRKNKKRKKKYHEIILRLF